MTNVMHRFFNLFIYLLLPYMFRAFFKPIFRGRCTNSAVVLVTWVWCQRPGQDRTMLPLLLNRWLGGPQRRSGHFGVEKNFFLLLGFEPRTVQPVRYLLYGLNLVPRLNPTSVTSILLLSTHLLPWP
jgi:hypothetical protein